MWYYSFYQPFNREEDNVVAECEYKELPLDDEENVSKQQSEGENENVLQKEDLI